MKVTITLSDDATSGNVRLEVSPPAKELASRQRRGVSSMAEQWAIRFLGKIIKESSQATEAEAKLHGIILP